MDLQLIHQNDSNSGIKINYRIKIKCSPHKRSVVRTFSRKTSYSVTLALRHYSFSPGARNLEKGSFVKTEQKRHFSTSMVLHILGGHLP